MAVIGTLDLWATAFPNDLVPQIIELVLSVWQELPKPTCHELEPRITRLLRHGLCQKKQRRRLTFRIGREEVIDDQQTGAEKGRIDILFMYGWDDNVYFAFECKRLNVPANGGRKSLVREYVEEGMARFVIGKYAVGLTQGGMIGFVMDGDTTTAVTKVDAEVRAWIRPLQMVPGTGLATSALFPATPVVRETKHPRREPALTLHHVFLAV